MNVIERNIGIWYKDREWAERVRDEIIENLPGCYFKHVINCGSYIMIHFIDGSKIKIVEATDYGKGCRFSESYIQKGISEQVYQDIIKPCIFPSNRDAYIINTAYDIAIGGEKAEEYYHDINNKCPLFDVCTCKTATCGCTLPDEGCPWYRWFKNRIKDVEGIK